MKTPKFLDRLKNHCLVYSFYLGLAGYFNTWVYTTLLPTFDRISNNDTLFGKIFIKKTSTSSNTSWILPRTTALSTRLSSLPPRPSCWCTLPRRLTMWSTADLSHRSNLDQQTSSLSTWPNMLGLWDLPLEISPIYSRGLHPIRGVFGVFSNLGCHGDTEPTPSPPFRQREPSAPPCCSLE